MLKVLDAQFLTSAASEAGCPTPSVPEIAFVGRSNVGKSSVINALLGRRKLARVSKTPGRTRLLNFFNVDVESAGRRWALRFTDLPGYGFARISKSIRSEWEEMITDYLRGRANLRSIVLVVDSEVGPTDADVQAVDYLKAFKKAVLVIATKLDRIPKAKRKPAIQQVSAQLKGASLVLPFSAVEHLGGNEVWDFLLSKLGEEVG